MTQVLLLQKQNGYQPPQQCIFVTLLHAGVWMFLDLYLYDVVGSSVSSAAPQLESGRMLPSFITLHGNRLETQPSQPSTPALTQGRPDPGLESMVLGPAAFSVLPGRDASIKESGVPGGSVASGRTEILAGFGSRRTGHPCFNRSTLSEPHIPRDC